VLSETGRPAESSALMKHAIELALEQDLAAQAMRGYFNLAEAVMGEARFADAEELLDRGLQIARRRGDRLFERWLLAQGVYPLVALGRWDEAIAQSARLREEADDIWAGQATMLLPHVLAARGDLDGLRGLLGQVEQGSGWRELEVTIKVSRAVILRETGHAQEAVNEARDGALAQIESALSHLPFLYLEAVECAFAADQPDVVRELVDRVDALKPAELIPLLEAEAVHARARLAVLDGDPAAADQWFRRAIDLLTEIGTPFLLARAQLGYAEFVVSVGGDAAASGSLRDQALSAFRRMKATPWIDRAQALEPAVAA
jgi:tetratricopeptide (TPR) repeat protein